jgi:hypothetical protein
MRSISRKAGEPDVAAQLRHHPPSSALMADAIGFGLRQYRIRGGVSSPRFRDSRALAMTATCVWARQEAASDELPNPGGRHAEDFRGSVVVSQYG